MREDLTEICMVIDRSGSMASLTDDTIGGINAFIRSQKEAPGDAILTTIFFSNTCDVVHDGICLESVPDVTRMDYIPMGCTALLDAYELCAGTIQTGPCPVRHHDGRTGKRKPKIQSRQDQEYDFRADGKRMEIHLHGRASRCV